MKYKIGKRKSLYFKVIIRPHTECYFIRTFNDRCKVEIPEIPEPFRIGIRVHGLKDTALGSFGMITDIEYKAEICLEPSKLINFRFN